MKEVIHIKSSFQTSDVGKLQKAVTEKVEKLANSQMKKAS